jgi:hypothetical protein
VSSTLRRIVKLFESFLEMWVRWRFKLGLALV